MLDIDRANILGVGSIGVVFKGNWDAIEVAVKQIPIDNAAKCEREVNEFKMLNHENIVKLFHIEENQNFRCYALELCIASLDKLFLRELDPNKCRFSMPPREEVLLQLAKGLEYIHKLGLVHGDIKPENALIWMNKENEKVVMKWADFGLSRRFNERATFSMSGMKETFSFFDWLAPELLKLLDNTATDEEEKSKQRETDVFAEGLLFGYYLTGGKHPFGSPVQIADNILTHKPINLSKIQPQNKRDLIQKMLADQPEKRITSPEIVNQLERMLSTTRINKIRLFTMFKTQVYPSVEEVKNLIKSVDINSNDRYGCTLLLYSVNNKKSGDAEGIIRFLIQNGANVNAKDHKGRNALQILCGNQETPNLLALIKLLLDNQIDVNCKNKTTGWNALHYLCVTYKKDNLIEIIRLLIENGIDVNCKDNFGRNAILILCEFDQKENLIDIVRFLLENGINVNCKNNDGLNILLYLCEHYEKENLIDIIRLLIENGIDVNCKNRNGDNALHLLCQFKKNKNLIEIIRLLIENGIDINCKNNDGSNAVLLLCPNYQKENLIDIIRLLIENGIDVNCKNIVGLNALHLLSRFYKNENLIGIIRFLLENGMDVNCKSNRGWNILHLLCFYYQNENLIDIIRLLIENGIDVNCKTNVGSNALDYLCQNYQKENLNDIIRLLIENRIEVTSETFA